MRDATTPIDRPPPLADLLTESTLRRCLEPFLGVGDVDGIAVFDRIGACFLRVHGANSPVRPWEQIPPEVILVRQQGTEGWFGLGEHDVWVWPLRAGGEDVGVVAISRPQGAQSGQAVVAVVPRVINELLQARHATWLTSELHLATSESHWRAMTEQNQELRRAVDHLRQLDQLKSNFLATVSHELRTPLTSIIGYSEMLLGGVAGTLVAEQREYVRTIMTRGEELLALISGLLEMSQLEGAGVRLELQPVDLAQVVVQAVDVVAQAATQADVTVTPNLGPVPPVLADADKLQRILVNLIANAVKFSPRGAQVTIEAVVAPIRRPFAGESLFGAEAADAVRISVCDQGIGIPEDQLERIFEAFHQVDAGPTRRRGGAGLGLSIVRGLVAAHGGEVWAQRGAEGGTTIAFTMPLASEELGGA